MEVFSSINEQLLAQTRPSVLLDKIEFKLNENENNLNDHKQLKQQYHFLKPDPKFQQQQQTARLNGDNLIVSSPNKLNGISNKNDGIPSPKYVLCQPNAIQLEWKQSRSIGAGYHNLGNTCFMNSVLQALTYCPPLANYLLYTSQDHQNKCKVLGLCMTCELIKHMRNSFQNSGGTIRPQNIFGRLKSLAKHFQPGRQEDSHEFLRYVIDNIWKSCIINWESNHSGIKLDNQSKETTFINQIFGGYHRSQITCLNCKAKSDTYDYFMDFILDIKFQSVNSLEKALEQFIQPDILKNENAYKCSKCNKKVPAEKRFTVHRAPNVATFQLKRFDYNRIFGGKIQKNISYPETLNLRPYMSKNRGEPINYKLFSVLVHLGCTSNSGHYFCYVRNSNNNWYLMDDSSVSSTSLSRVLDQQAYMLFYLRIPSNKQSINRTDSLKNGLLSNSSDKLFSLINHNGNGKLTVNHSNNNKPNGLIHKEEVNMPKLILSSIDSKINNNLSKSTSTLSIDNGDKKQENNGIKKFKSDDHDELKLKSSSNSLDSLSNSNDQNNKSINSSNNNKINDNQHSNQSTPNKAQFEVNRTTNGYSFNSTTEWQVISTSRNKKRHKDDHRSKEESQKSRYDSFGHYSNNHKMISSQKNLNQLSHKYNRTFLNDNKKDVISTSRNKKRHKDDHSSKEESQKSRYDFFSHYSNNHKMISSQKNLNELSQQYNRTFLNDNKKDVKKELNDMHLNLLGNNVNTWDGKKTQIDREVKEDLERSKKKSKDDMYNEEYDRGKSKKMKLHHNDNHRKGSGNPFQKFYNDQYLKSSTEKNKFIKSL